MLTDKTNPVSLPAKFQKYFWDVAFDELSFEKFPRFIAERLLNYGDLSDMKWQIGHRRSPLMIRPLDWGTVKQHLITITGRFTSNL